MLLSILSRQTTAVEPEPEPAPNPEDEDDDIAFGDPDTPAYFNTTNQPGRQSLIAKSKPKPLTIEAPVRDFFNALHATSTGRFLNDPCLCNGRNSTTANRSTFDLLDEERLKEVLEAEHRLPHQVG